jgi:hypothetical protein
MEPKFILIYERLDNLDGKLNNGYVYLTEFVRFFEKEDIEKYLNDSILHYIGFKMICAYEIKEEIHFTKTIIEKITYEIQHTIPNR